MIKIDFYRTLNTRDLGGYPTLTGLEIKPGRFIRSDAPNHLLRAELDYLYDLGITTSIDLRTPRVANKYRSSFRDDQRFAYHQIPIVEGSDIPLNEEQVPELYLSMLDHHDTFKAILETIAKAPQGVIYNCSAGKDRTGMVTFILLELAGVPRSIIADDYELSSSLIDKKIPFMQSIDPSFPSYLGASKREYIERFFTLFDAKYHTIDTYLNIIGISMATREQLYRRLLHQSKY